MNETALFPRFAVRNRLKLSTLPAQCDGQDLLYLVEFSVFLMPSGRCRNNRAFLLNSKTFCNLRNVVKRESLPWATVTVWGFADSPVGWNLREHGYHLHGDNNYTFVVFPDDTYWLLTTLGTHDMTF